MNRDWKKKHDATLLSANEQTRRLKGKGSRGGWKSRRSRGGWKKGKIHGGALQKWRQIWTEGVDGSVWLEGMHGGERPHYRRAENSFCNSRWSDVANKDQPSENDPRRELALRLQPWRDDGDSERRRTWPTWGWGDGRRHEKRKSRKTERWGGAIALGQKEKRKRKSKMK